MQYRHLVTGLIITDHSKNANKNLKDYEYFIQMLTIIVRNFTDFLLIYRDIVFIIRNKWVQCTALYKIMTVRRRNLWIITTEITPITATK